MAAFTCALCTRAFTEHRTLIRHTREVHEKRALHECSSCGLKFKRTEALRTHQFKHTTTRQQVPSTNDVDADLAFEEVNHDRYTNVRSYTLRSDRQFEELWLMYRAVQKKMRRILVTNLNEMGMLKFNFILNVTFEKATDPTETISCYFHSKTVTLSFRKQLYRLVLKAFKQVNKAAEDYVQRGSGWVVRSLNALDLHVLKYQPVRGRSYLPLPPRLKNKKAIINVQNKDSKCFMWSVLAALHPVDRTNNANRVSKYEKYVNEGFEGIDFPVKVEDINRFEKLNDISINVYGYHTKVQPVYLSQYKAKRQLSLLLLNDQHYCWIKVPERFFYKESTHGHRLHQCHLCMCLFHSKAKRDKHVLHCANPDLQTLEMPEEDTWLSFKNYRKMLRQPYIIYADFECLLEKIQGCEQNPKYSHTTKYQQHMPCGYGLVEVFRCCTHKQQCGQSDIYRGENTVRMFLNHVLDWGERYQRRRDKDKPVTMSESDWNAYHVASTCHICNKALEDERVVDHCHVCGKYSGAAHSNCNLNYRLSRDVVVVFHNLRRYDGHLILEQLGKLANDKGISIFAVPKGLDDFLTFSLRLRHKVTSNLKFIDSSQFMRTSLDKLVDNLRDKGDDRFTITHSMVNPTLVPLVLRKGVYSYDYMDSWVKFNETALPTISEFTSSLTGEQISHADYAHAIDVWSQFGLKALGEYHDLYLQTDVLLLADAFKNFRNLCLENYGLDPAHYYTSTSFSWDACLKLTGVELELLTDVDMYTFFEEGIRGGVSQISHRYAKANNKYLDDFDPSVPISYIIYQDMQNLYGWTMTEPLPISDFRWLEGVDAFDLWSVPCDGDTGYVLEVDLDYPEYLYDSHNDYPLAVERFTVTDEMLSPYCQRLKSTLRMGNAIVEKLVPNLRNKRKYIVHFRNLKLYLSLGLHLKKIHRILAFKQRRWMEPYIQFNTEMRKRTKSTYEKDLFKLYNNSVFGKTMENVRHYKEIKLVSDERQLVKLGRKFWFRTANGFS